MNHRMLPPLLERTGWTGTQRLESRMHSVSEWPAAQAISGGNRELPAQTGPWWALLTALCLVALVLPAFPAGAAQDMPLDAGGASSSQESRAQGQKGLQVSPLTRSDTAPLYTPLRYAIVVGVNRSSEKSLPPLKYAERDALQMEEALLDPLVGGFDRVVRLIDPDRAALLAAVEEARRLLRPSDLFFLYYSGHGTAAIDDALKSSLFLMVRGAQFSTLGDTALNVRRLQEALGRMQPLRKVLLIDACYNGEGKSGLSSAAKDRRQQPKGAGAFDVVSPLRESEAHLFAAAFGQPALEDRELGGSVYTTFFLQALRAPQLADTNQDGGVSVGEAHNYSRDQTMMRTSNRQVPWASYRIVGREDIFLAGTGRSKAEQALLYTFSEKYRGARVTVNGTPKGQLPDSIPLEPGELNLALYRPDGSLMLEGDIRLRPDQALSIEDLEARVQAGQQRLTVWRWSSLGFTAATAAAAGVAGMQALNIHTLYQTADFDSAEQAEQVKSLGLRYQGATNVLLGTTALSAGLSIWLHISPPKFKLRDFPMAARVLPVLQYQGGALALQGQF